jgi:signal peptidase I
VGSDVPPCTLTYRQDRNLTEQLRAEEHKQKETLPESIAGFAAVFVSGLFIITFVIQHFEIPSRSMEQTLLVGDHVFVDRMTPTGSGFTGPLLPYSRIHRGDIAVFVSPAEPGLYLVKRIIGVPGDRIHLSERKLFINGVAQKEPYVYYDDIPSHHAPDLYRDNFPAASPLSGFTPPTPEWQLAMQKYIDGPDLVIPKDHYFAMGDNRDLSYDSRFWGFVPKENIMGRPLFIAWSLNQTEADFEAKSMPERLASFLHTAAHFVGMTRWNRTLHLVH